MSESRAAVVPSGLTITPLKFGVASDRLKPPSLSAVTPMLEESVTELTTMEPPLDAVTTV